MADLEESRKGAAMGYSEQDIEVAAKAFCAEWGYDWGHVAGDSCCSGYSCDGVAPEGEEGTYERPSHNTYRFVARRMLMAVEKSRADREIGLRKLQRLGQEADNQ